MADVAMPRLSDSMEEGTILKWLKSDGDEVKRGEELVEIETDKANMTYEADSDGVLSIVAKEGDTLPVGETIARLGDGSEAGGAEEQPEADTAEDEQPAAEEKQPEEQPSGNGKPSETPETAPAEAQTASGNGDGDGRVKASPVAKRMAREMGVELGQLKGSGPGGRIVKADVEAAAKGGGGAATAEAEAPPQEQAAPAAEEQAPEEKQADVPPPVVAGERDGQTGRGDVTHQDLTRLQQTVARRMAESKATAPDFVLDVEVDMEDAVELRKGLKAAAGDQPAPSFNDFVIKAAALALRDFPRANGAYRDGKWELYSRVNVGIAVAAQDALVVPTVFDADLKGLRQISSETRALAGRVRDGSITPPELSGGTFTVSNLGMYGISNFSAVINTPQAGILAVGELKAKPVVTDSGEIEPRQLMGVTLACDHRILYGADGAQFLARVRELLEEPLGLAL